MTTTGAYVTSNAVNFLTYVADYSSNPGSTGRSSSVQPSSHQVVSQDVSPLLVHQVSEGVQDQGGLGVTEVDVVLTY